MLAALVAVCHGVAVLPAAPVYGGYGGYPAAVGVAKVAAVDDYDPNPQYSYSYDIHVSQTNSTTKDIFQIFEIIHIGCYHW